jgi:hypothetical protein
MSSSSASPDGIPAHGNLQKDLLVNYALREYWDEAEDGVEGPTSNYDKYSQRYVQALGQLQAFIGDEDIEPTEFPDELHLDAYLG